MTVPAGEENAFLRELEGDVREEMTEEEAIQPLQDSDGVPTDGWQTDPYAPRYEVGLRSLLGAVEAAEEGPREP